MSDAHLSASKSCTLDRGLLPSLRYFEAVSWDLTQAHAMPSALPSGLVYVMKPSTSLLSSPAFSKKS